MYNSTFCGFEQLGSSLRVALQLLRVHLHQAHSAFLSATPSSFGPSRCTQAVWLSLLAAARPSGSRRFRPLARSARWCSPTSKRGWIMSDRPTTSRSTPLRFCTSLTLSFVRGVTSPTARARGCGSTRTLVQHSKRGSAVRPWRECTNGIQRPVGPLGPRPGARGIARPVIAATAHRGSRHGLGHCRRRRHPQPLPSPWRPLRLAAAWCTACRPDAAAPRAWHPTQRAPRMPSGEEPAPAGHAFSRPLAWNQSLHRQMCTKGLLWGRLAAEAPQVTSRPPVV